MVAFPPDSSLSTGITPGIHTMPTMRWCRASRAPAPALPAPVASTDADDDDDLGDEEDLAVSDPLADEESNFDDFDDEFDDDFEEEENDPDWDHTDDTDGEEPPPGKTPGRKK